MSQPTKPPQNPDNPMADCAMRKRIKESIDNAHLHFRVEHREILHKEVVARLKTPSFNDSFCLCLNLLHNTAGRSRLFRVAHGVMPYENMVYSCCTAVSLFYMLP
jgi:hypothetical protein